MDDVQRGATNGNDADQRACDEVDAIVADARAAVEAGRRDDAVIALAGVYSRELEDESYERIAAATRELDLGEPVLKRLRGEIEKEESSTRWLALGLAQLRLESIDAAVESMQTAVGLPDPGEFAWLSLYLAANQLADPAPALRVIETLLAMWAEPERRIQLLCRKVRLLERSAQYDLALEAHGDVVEAWSQATPIAVHSVLATTVVLAMALHGVGRDADAQRALDRVQVDPVDPDLRLQTFFARGAVRIGLGDLAGALPYLAHGAPRAPEEFRLGWHVAYALALEDLGRFVEAEGVLRQAAALMGAHAASGLVPQILARVLLGQNKLEEATAVVDALSIDSLDGAARAHALNSRGLVRLASGDHARALEDFRAAHGIEAALDPGFDLNAASTLFQMERLAEAVSELERLEGKLPASSPVELARLQMLFGAQVKESRLDDAITTLDRAAAIPGPHVGESLGLRARLMAPRRPPENALAAFVRAIPLAEAREPAVRLRLEGAIAAERANDRARSAQWIGEAVSLSSGERDALWAEAAYAQAALHLRSGELRAALALLRSIEAAGVELASVPRFLSTTWRTIVDADGAHAALEWIDVLETRLGLRFAPFVALLRGETLLKLGDSRRAESVFAAGARLSPELRADPVAVLAALRCAILAGDAETALAQATALRNERALTDVREDLDVLRASALFLLERGQEALAAFEALRPERRAGDLETRVMYAQALTVAKRHRDALSELDEIVRNDAAPPALTRLAHANRALAFVALGDRERADEAADRVLADSDSLDATELVATYLARHAKAMALFGEAREDLHSSMKSRRKAEKALKMLRAVAAEADENRLADSAPMRKIRGLAWFAAAGVAYVLDQEDDAIGYCDKSIAAGAPGPAVLNLKGSAQLVLGDHERARLTFGEVLASKADDDARFEALSGAGRAHHHLGEHDLAVDLFRSALAMPCDDARTDPVVMQRLAESYDELGRHTAALHAYRRAWRRFGKRERPARLVTGISAMLLRLNQPEEARAFIEQERKHAVADRAIDFNLALSLARLGDTKRAVEVAEQIKTWKPAAELLDALGRSAGRDWSGHWFGEPGSARSWAGALLLAMVAIGFFAPPVLQLWREGTVDLEHALPLGAIALVLFVLPVAKSLNVEVPGLKLGVEPASRGREEDGKALDRIAPASLTAALRAPALPPRSDVATRAGEPDEVAREAEDFANRGLKVRVAIDEPSDDDADETGAPRKYRRRPRAGRAPSKS